MRVNELEIRATLRLARCLISTPEKWCKGSFKDQYGRYCAVGACLEACTQLGFEVSWQAVGRLQEHVDGGIIGYNDLHTHEEVLEVFNKAIKEIDNDGVHI